MLEWDCSRVKICHLSGTVSLGALAFLVNQHLHVCQGEVRLGTQESMLEDLMEMGGSEDFGRRRAQR